MILTFSPDDGEPRVWQVKLDRLMQPEAELIERKTGMTYDGFGAALLQGSALARRALAFVFEKRTHPTLTWESFGDFAVSAITLEFDAEEMADAIASVEKSMPDGDERDAVLVQLRALAEDAPQAPKEVPASSSGEPVLVTSPTSSI